jgi:nitrate reductase gamma subunit
VTGESLLATALFTYGPYFAVFGFLAARLYRWGILRDQPVPAARALSAPFEGALAVGFLTLAVGQISTAVAPHAMRALLSDPDRVAVIETIGLIGALLFGAGLVARLWARVRAHREGAAGHGVPALVLGLLLLLTLSGIYLTVSHRWITVWYAYISVPYTRSLFLLEPEPESLVASPWAIQVHTLLFMALVAAWPAGGLSLEEIFPLRALARRLALAPGGADAEARGEEARS